MELKPRKGHVLRRAASTPLFNIFVGFIFCFLLIKGIDFGWSGKFQGNDHVLEDPVRPIDPLADRTLVYQDEDSVSSDKAVLTMFQQYHSTEAWPHLFGPGEGIYRGLCQVLGNCRPNSRDFRAPDVLKILKNPYYQDLTCEYGGFFALETKILSEVQTPWLGFQSWRADDKGFALSEVALDQVQGAIRENAHGSNALYYWSNTGVNTNVNETKDFYASCDRYHQNNCSTLFGSVLAQLFNFTRDDPLPPMPTTDGTWAYMSYFIMSKTTFSSYIKFARMFFVIMDAIYYEEHHDQHSCPLAGSTYEYSHCWCYIMERLINLWAYHKGLPMMHVDPETGSMQAQHPVSLRDRWYNWFGKANMARISEAFPIVIKKKDRLTKLFVDLGGGI